MNNKKIEMMLKILDYYMKDAYGYRICSMNVVYGNTVLFCISEQESSGNYGEPYGLIFEVDEPYENNRCICIRNTWGDDCLSTMYDADDYTQEEIEKDMEGYAAIIKEYTDHNTNKSVNEQDKLFSFSTEGLSVSGRQDRLEELAESISFQSEPSNALADLLSEIECCFCLKP